MQYKALSCLGASYLLLTGCVTLDTQAMPDIFKGTATLIDDPKSIIIKNGPIAVGEIFAEKDIGTNRSAQLKNDVYLKNKVVSKGKTMARKGDVFYALPVVYADLREKTSEFSWCRGGKDGVSKTKSKLTGAGKSTCLYWSNGIPRLAIGSRGSQNAPSGKPLGPMFSTNIPEFKDLGPSDIGVLKLRVKIHKLNSKGLMTVITTFQHSSGKDSTQKVRQYFPEDDGSYLIDVFDGELRARNTAPEGKHAVFTLEVTKPLEG